MNKAAAGWSDTERLTEKCNHCAAHWARSENRRQIQRNPSGRRSYDSGSLAGAQRFQESGKPTFPHSDRYVLHRSGKNAARKRNGDEGWWPCRYRWIWQRGTMRCSPSYSRRQYTFLFGSAFLRPFYIRWNRSYLFLLFCDTNVKDFPRLSSRFSPNGIVAWFESKCKNRPKGANKMSEYGMYRDELAMALWNAIC